MTFEDPHSRRYLLSLPIPTLSPSLHSHSVHDLTQLLRCKFRREQLLLWRTAPELLTQACFHSTWVQGDTHSILSTPLPQVNIHRLSNGIYGRFACTIAIPSSQAIFRDGAHPGGHDGKYGRGREIREWIDFSGLPGKEGREVFGKQKGSEGVYLEGLMGFGVIDLRGRLFGI